MSEAADYLGPEAQARVDIDRQLTAAGWVVQRHKQMNLGAGRGVAVREFPMAEGQGDADSLLFVDRKAVGVVEAKKKGSTLTGVEWQSAKYTTGLPDNVPALTKPLAFAYESTGVETRFTNAFDPEPASRQVFTCHRPDTLIEWVRAWSEGGGVERATFRQRLRGLPPLDPAGLWPAQEAAIRNLEVSLTHFRPRALIQMATGSGKTFTAANISYRLIKHADASRILFLVDRANLGRQTLKEFQAFTTPDDGRKFSEIYNVQHLQSNTIDKPSRVVISTIQRLYSILRGDPEMAPELDETSAFELEPAAPMDVTYNPAVPIETFDVIVVDECHRSIYGVWRQVLDYFDTFIIGLTATPGKQTFAFFDQNMVMEYNHEQAVADGVNVDFDVYRIDTHITGQGSSVDAGLVTKFRDRQTREVRLEKLDADVNYDSAELDRKVVAKDQLRTITWTGLDLSDVKEMHFSAEEVETYRLMPSDVLVAEASGSRGEVGKPALWRGEFDDCCFQNTLLRVLTYGPKPTYLLHFLRCEALSGRLGEAARGVGIHHLGAAGLSSYPVPIPPLVEQERIVAAIEEQFSRLDAAEDGVRSALRRAAAMEAALFESTWHVPAEWSSLGNVAAITTGTTPPTNDGSLWNGPFPFVTPGDLLYGRASRTSSRSLTQEGAARSRSARRGCVLLTCIGATIGKASLAAVECAFNQQINAIEPSGERLDPRFLLYAMSAPSGQKAIWESSSSTTLPILNKTRLGHLLVPVPRLALQRALIENIERELSRLDATTITIGRVLTRSHHLRQSILERAFSGQLVPQDPNDEPASELLARVAHRRAARSGRSSPSRDCSNA